MLNCLKRNHMEYVTCIFYQMICHILSCRLLQILSNKPPVSIQLLGHLMVNVLLQEVLTLMCAYTILKLRLFMRLKVRHNQLL